MDDTPPRRETEYDAKVKRKFEERIRALKAANLPVTHQNIYDASLPVSAPVPNVEPELKEDNDKHERQLKTWLNSMADDFNLPEFDENLSAADLAEKMEKFLKETTPSGSYKVRSGVFGYKAWGLFFKPAFTLKEGGLDFGGFFVKWEGIKKAVCCKRKGRETKGQPSCRSIELQLAGYLPKTNLTITQNLCEKDNGPPMTSISPIDFIKRQLSWNLANRMEERTV